MGCNLDNSDLKGALYDKDTIWPDGFDYQNSGAYGPNANLKSANLSEVDLSDADLSGADLRGADLSNSILSKAHRTSKRRVKKMYQLRAMFGGHKIYSVGVNLKDALYNKNTIWPKGFEPKSAGAILKEEG